jgi:6-phosphogluconolactonase
MDDTTAHAQALIVVGSYADATQPGIHLFRFDYAAGTLTPHGAIAGIANPSFVAAHPHRPWLYAVSETSKDHDGTPGSVWALRLARDPVTLQPANHQPSGGDSPCHIQLDASGRWLFVCNYGSGTIAVLPIQPDSTLGEMTDLVQHHGSGAHPQRQAAPHTHSSACTPDQRFVVVADLGIDHLLVYAFDSAAGKLSAHTHVRTRAAAGPRHIAFHPSGRFMYVTNELDNTVSVYDYHAGDGALHERQTIETVQPGPLDNAAAHIHVAPSGRHVYVSNRGHDSITIFDVEADGRLTRRTTAPCGGQWPRHFAVVPGFMLVANERSDEVSVLPLAGLEALAAPRASTRVAQAACVHIMAADD